MPEGICVILCVSSACSLPQDTSRRKPPHRQLTVHRLRKDWKWSDDVPDRDDAERVGIAGLDKAFCG